MIASKKKILICAITRGMQRSVTPYTHEINEYKQNCFNTFGNKFCKNFSHYEFLVQFVFAPHFKQIHIPRYYVTQQQKNPREHGKCAESKNCEILLFPTANTEVKCPTWQASF